VFIVRTIPELQEAVGYSSREVMVVGALAPKIVEKRDGHALGNVGRVSSEESLTSLLADFTIHTVRDSSEKVIAAVFQQRNINNGLARDEAMTIPTPRNRP